MIHHAFRTRHKHAETLLHEFNWHRLMVSHPNSSLQASLHPLGPVARFSFEQTGAQLLKWLQHRVAHLGLLAPAI